MAISEKGVKKAKELSGMKSGTLGDDANKIAKFSVALSQRSFIS